MGGAAPPPRSGRAVYDQSVDIWSFGVIVFVVLSGYHPFNPMGSLDENSVVQNARDGNWSFVDPLEGSDAWEGVSDSARDLITNMIVVEPTQVRVYSTAAAADAAGAAGPAATRGLKKRRRSALEVQTDADAALAETLQRQFDDVQGGGQDDGGPIVVEDSSSDHET